MKGKHKSKNKYQGFLGGSVVKNLPANARDRFNPWFGKIPHAVAEKAMAPNSSTLAWKIPWTEEPGRLQSMGSLRVGHDWVTSLSLFTFMHWRRKWQPTPVFLPEESQGRGAWWAAVYGVTQSRTRLKRLSSSSSSIAIVRKLRKLSNTGYELSHSHEWIHMFSNV